MPLKAIFLEFRGILIDDRSLQAELMKTLLLQQNLCLKPQEYEDLITETDDRSCLQILLERRGRVPTVADLNQLLQQRFHLSEQVQGNDRSSLLLADVKDFLFRVRSLSLKLALITSSSRGEVNALLEREAISAYFDLILCGDHLPYQPIKPWGYTHAIDSFNQGHPTLNLIPQECLALESIYPHLAAARSVGLTVAAVSRYRPFHFLQRRADWTVDRLTDLDLEWVAESLTPRVLDQDA